MLSGNLWCIEPQDVMINNYNFKSDGVPITFKVLEIIVSTGFSLGDDCCTNSFNVQSQLYLAMQNVPICVIGKLIM